MVKYLHKAIFLPVVNSGPQRQSRHSRIQAEMKYMYNNCLAQMDKENEYSTCVIQRKVSITVLAIGAIRLNLRRFAIYFVIKFS